MSRIYCSKKDCAFNGCTIYKPFDGPGGNFYYECTRDRVFIDKGYCFSCTPYKERNVPKGTDHGKAEHDKSTT